MSTPSQTCGAPPPEESAVAFFLTQSPCELYAEVKRAYLALLTGNQRQRVRIADRDAWYTKADAHLLREEMQRLAAQCRQENPALAAALGANPRAGCFHVTPFALPTPYRL